MTEDTGASGLIAEGKIKLKSDSEIERFEEEDIVFKNGSRLRADVVVFATGYVTILLSVQTCLADLLSRLGDARKHVERVCGKEVADRCGPIWGLNEEGELNGVWRDLGVRGLWYMIGNLALCRFHSTHLTLRTSFAPGCDWSLIFYSEIKAIEEGIFGTRYSRK